MNKKVCKYIGLRCVLELGFYCKLAFLFLLLFLFIEFSKKITIFSENADNKKINAEDKNSHSEALYIFQ